MVRKLVNVFDYRDQARKRLARIAYDYLEEAAEDGLSLARNREAFARIDYVPRVLTGIESVDLTAALFGRRYPLPLIIGPTGNASFFWANGDLALARAASIAGIPFVLSTNASARIEDLAAGAEAERWFQLYALKDDAKTDELVRRAHEAGYTALALTVDCAASGKREASLRHGSRIPMRLSLPLIMDALAHPRWTYQMLRHGTPRWANLSLPIPPGGRSPTFSFDATFKRAVSWKDVARIRKLWPGTFILKGVQSLADVSISMDNGINGVVLSNHGGRQLDGSPSPMQLLPGAVAAAGNAMTIMIDGGIRRGGDIVKAIALGASAVWLGRAPLYGLAARGEAGVVEVLEILRDEMERAMILLGVDSLEKLDAGCVASSPPASRI